MEHYKNLGGDSGISAFDIGETSITIYFKKGGIYVYNYLRPGRAEVEHMKILAINGVGLNSYIQRYVGIRYAQRLR